MDDIQPDSLLVSSPTVAGRQGRRRTRKSRVQPTVGSSGGYEVVPPVSASQSGSLQHRLSGTAEAAVPRENTGTGVHWPVGSVSHRTVSVLQMDIGGFHVLAVEEAAMVSVHSSVIQAASQVGLITYPAFALACLDCHNPTHPPAPTSGYVWACCTW